MSRQPTRLTLALVTAALAIALLAACSGSDKGPRTPLGAASSAVPNDSIHAGLAAQGGRGGASTIPPDARLALDSGNVYFSVGKYEQALASYRNAAARAPTSDAPLFGIQMAATKLGNARLRDSAAGVLRAHNPGSEALSDSMLRRMHENVAPKPAPRPAASKPTKTA